MGAILAFLTSPLGAILIKEVPELVGQIIKIAHDKGLVKPEEWVAYINAQKKWEDVPTK
jgi:hypothetical protein